MTGAAYFRAYCKETNEEFFNHLFHEDCIAIALLYRRPMTIYKDVSYGTKRIQPIHFGWPYETNRVQFSY